MLPAGSWGVLGCSKGCFKIDLLPMNLQEYHDMIIMGGRGSSFQVQGWPFPLYPLMEACLRLISSCSAPCLLFEILLRRSHSVAGPAPSHSSFTKSSNIKLFQLLLSISLLLFLVVVASRAPTPVSQFLCTFVTLSYSHTASISPQIWSSSIFCRPTPPIVSQFFLL